MSSTTRITARIPETEPVSCSDPIGSGAPAMWNVTEVDTSGLSGVWSLLTRRAVGRQDADGRAHVRGQRGSVALDELQANPMGPRWQRDGDWLDGRQQPRVGAVHVHVDVAFGRIHGLPDSARLH